jgi:catechol 2,3-dioxygenase-like lactoylglutathione lyase family enzyme
MNQEEAPRVACEPRSEDKLMVPYIHPSEQLVVELSVRDLNRSLRFYQGFGFDLIRQGPRFAVLAWEGHQLFLQQTDDLPEPAVPAILNLRVMVPDADEVWRRERDLATRVVVPLGNRNYGLRDFTIADPDGYELRFATRLPDALLFPEEDQFNDSDSAGDDR